MLIELQQSFNIYKLDEEVTSYIKKKFKPVPEQSEEEYLEELRDEILLEKAYRLRCEADRLENLALKEQRQNIRLAYNENGKLTVKD